MTTTEIQTLEFRNSCLNAQHEELKRNLKETEDQAVVRHRFFFLGLRRAGFF